MRRWDQSSGVREQRSRSSWHVHDGSESTSNQRLIVIGEHPIAMRPLKLLFSQQTGCCEQELPLSPMPEIPEHSRPTRMLAGSISPRSSARRPTSELLESATELQHWIGPVLQELEMPEGLLLRAADTPVARRTGGRGGRPRARRSAFVSEGLA